MRCTDCKYSKETIPTQKYYVYCSKYEKEVATDKDFETCQYEETDEYKLKKAISDYCNNEDNWIVAVSQYNLLKALAKEFNIPSFVDDIIADRDFNNKVFEVLNDSKVKLGNGVLVTHLDDIGELRESLLILQKPY